MSDSTKRAKAKKQRDEAKADMDAGKMAACKRHVRSAMNTSGNGMSGSSMPH